MMAGRRVLMVAWAKEPGSCPARGGWGGKGRAASCSADMAAAAAARLARPCGGGDAVCRLLLLLMLVPRLSLVKGLQHRRRPAVSSLR